MITNATPFRERLLPLALLLMAVYAPAEASAAINYLQSSTVANRIVRLGQGNVYLLTQGTLFRMQRGEGDVWQRVADGVGGASFDPRNERIIYLIKGGTVLKSLDGGARWLSINNGLPSRMVNFILISPTNPDEVFAGTEAGLYKTSDAGFSWEPTTLRSPVSSFYINLTSPEHRYALGGEGAVFVSADAGQTWKKSEAGLPFELVRGRDRSTTKVTLPVAGLFFVGQAKSYLLAAVDGKGIYRSDDHGASWRAANIGLRPGDRFRSAYVGETEVVLAGSSLARSVDGMNWTTVPVKTLRLLPDSYGGVIRHPNADGLLVLFKYAQDTEDVERIGYVGKSGALVGLNYGLMPRSHVVGVWPGQFEGRQAIFATVSNSTPTRLGSARSVRDGTYFTVTGEYSIETATYVSVDDGYSWEYVLSPECGTAAALRRGDPKEVWFYGRAPCLLRPDGGAASWSKAAGATFLYGNESVSKLVFDPADKGLLYYSTGVNERRLYRYRFNPARNEGQTVDLKVLAADFVVCEDDPKMIFAGVGRLSTDGGWTWADKSAALRKHITNRFGEGYRRDDLTLLACRVGEIRVAVHHYGRFGRLGLWVMKSTNLGDSWEVSSYYQGGLQRLFINPDDSKNMFAVVMTYVKDRYSSRNDAVRVLETTDWGETWREVYAYKLTKDDQYHEEDIVNAVSQAKAGERRTLFIGGIIGLWRSDDEGQLWSRLGGVR